MTQILKYIKKTPGQGLHYEDKWHTQIVDFCDAYWAGSPIDRCSTTRYCVFIDENIIFWKSKKKSVVARSNAYVEYRVMATITYELFWIKQLLS